AIWKGHSRRDDNFSPSTGRPIYSKCQISFAVRLAYCPIVLRSCCNALAIVFDSLNSLSDRTEAGFRRENGGFDYHHMAVWAYPHNLFDVPAISASRAAWAFLECLQQPRQQHYSVLNSQDLKRCQSSATDPSAPQCCHQVSSRCFQSRQRTCGAIRA